jgi:hypothetical protein
MTEVRIDRAAYIRERGLEWIEDHFLDGKEVAQALRAGPPEDREQTIRGLEGLALSMSRKSEAGNWAYSYPKHMHVCRIIKQERALLAAEELQAARRKHQAASHQVRHHLHRRGWTPISVLRRLGNARGGFLAALAGRCSGEDAR